eukprot:m51a1_g14068 ATP-dependent DNA helicase 2 subunit 1 (907) ;mRNA; f:1235016-1238916
MTHAQAALLIFALALCNLGRAATILCSGGNPALPQFIPYCRWYQRQACCTTFQQTSAVQTFVQQIEARFERGEDGCGSRSQHCTDRLIVAACGPACSPRQARFANTSAGPALCNSLARDLYDACGSHRLPATDNGTECVTVKTKYASASAFAASLGFGVDETSSKDSCFSSAPSASYSGIGSSQSTPQSSGGFWDQIAYDDDDDYGDANADKYYSSRDSIVFLVDARPAMFEASAAGAEVPFVSALRAAAAVYQDKIISSDDDLIGFCLYGTEQKKNSNDFEGVYVLFDLDVPDAPRILELEKLQGAKEPPFGTCRADFPFGDALWTCSSMFSNCKVKVGHRRIFLFTNDDNPNAGDDRVQAQSVQRARDLAELGIAIELFGMRRSGAPFSRAHFFSRLVGEATRAAAAASEASGEEAVQSEVVDAPERFDELLHAVRRREHRKRSLGRLLVSLGPHEMSVRVYKLIRRADKGRHTTLDARTNAQLRSTTQWFCEDTGAPLAQGQIKYAYPYGGERVVFEKSELDSLKAVELQGIRILGFKPRSSVKPYHNIKTSAFLYPDESGVRGSTVALSALVDQMLELGRVAIARMTQRDNAVPRLVALMPAREQYDADGTPSAPAGLHVVFLPYSDDIRSVRLPAAERASADDVAKAKRVVKRLRIQFDSRQFENPSLQRHFALLQALALDRDVADSTTDLLVPDSEGMARHADAVEELARAVFPAGYDPDNAGGKSGSRKRSSPEVDEAGGEDGARPSKRRRGAEAGEFDWIAAAESGQVGKATVPQLREFLKAGGVQFASKDKKEALVALATEHALALAAMASEPPIDSESPASAPAPAAPTRHQSPPQNAPIDGDEEEAKGSGASGSCRADDARMPCQYGLACYRKNPAHFDEYSHPPEHPLEAARKK